MRDEDKNQHRNTIISNALTLVSSDLAAACIEKNYFITAVSEPKEVNGIVRPNHVVIIDTENEAILNYEQFMQHSRKLYLMFDSIKTWYR